MGFSVASARGMRVLLAFAAVMLVAQQSWASFVILYEDRSISANGSVSGWYSDGSGQATDGPYSWTESDASASDFATFNSTVSGGGTAFPGMGGDSGVAAGASSASQSSDVNAAAFHGSGSSDISSSILSQTSLDASYGGSVSVDSTSFFDVMFELTDASYVSFSGSVFADGSAAESSAFAGLASFDADGNATILALCAAGNGLDGGPYPTTASGTWLLEAGVYEVIGLASNKLDGSTQDSFKGAASYNFGLTFIPVIPEPATISLLGMGLCGMVLARVRRRR